jgi:hypothetical protein
VPRWVPTAIVILTTAVVAAFLLLEAPSGRSGSHSHGAGTGPALTGTIALLPPSPLSAASGSASIWTGREWLIWGGTGSHGKVLADGSSYDPSRHRWGVLPTPPLPPLTGAVSVWTGSAWLVIGGDDALGRAVAAGATFDPGSGRWTAVAPAPFALGAGTTGAWTGTDLVVLTGPSPAPQADRAAAYDPQTDRWTTLPRPPGAAPVGSRDAVWTGRFLVALRDHEPGGRLFAAAYDPGRGTWSSFGWPVLDVRETSAATLEWTGRSLLVLQPGAGPAGASYLPASHRWQLLPPIPARVRSAVTLGGPPTWTGSMAVYWGGGDIGLDYDSRTGRWSELPAGDLPPRQEPATAWTGHAVLAWGGVGRDGEPVADGISYTPAG